ncbi:MAG: actin-like protein arp8 [Alyxoria varia]|nr:MAG: actin-like protein arp8 [Alyxoria varia]
MPGRKGARGARDEGLERTDNQMEFASWPQVSMINQKNYYTEYLRRDEQVLVLRQQNEENRNRMAKEAREKDRAQNGIHPDMEMDVDETLMGEDGTAGSAESTAQGSKVIVIHPGSQNLRIGLASDALPKTLPMVIAHRAPMNKSEEPDVEARPKRHKLDGDVSEEASKAFGDEFAKHHAHMSTNMKSRMRKKGRRLVPNSKDVAIGFNRKMSPDVISEHNDVSHIDWTEIHPEGDTSKGEPEYFTGQAALRIPHYSQPRYKLFWPLKFGCFNEADYGNKHQILRDFTTIIEDAIKNQLGISKRKDWAQYSCVFVIPDLYERNYVTTVLDLLIREFGFHRACFLQEGVSGSFGAGYPTCCIVDIGAQKTSICCVEEGLCLDNSRVNLRYGGQDVTETFVKLMITSCFPYSDIDLNRRHDFLLAEELKQKFCTLSIQDFTAQQHDFHLRVHGQDTHHYNFKAYDEVVIAPMCLFKTELLDNSDKLKGRRSLIGRSYDLYDGSPNDPISAAQTQVLAAAAPQQGDRPDLRGEPRDASTQRAQKTNADILGTDATPQLSVAAYNKPDENGTPQPGRLSTPMGGDKEPTITNGAMHPLTEMVHSAEVRDRTLPCIPLTKAIALSIEQGAKGDERKMRDFFGGIIAVGGGALIPDFKEFLEEELVDMQARMKKDIMVAPPPRDMDPQVVVWKGASVFGKLRANDSWVGATEYDRLGSRLLAYKCLWSW